MHKMQKIHENHTEMQHIHKEQLRNSFASNRKSKWKFDHLEKVIRNVLIMESRLQNKLICSISTISAQTQPFSRLLFLH